ARLANGLLQTNSSGEVSLVAAPVFLGPILESPLNLGESPVGRPRSESQSDFENDYCHWGDLSKGGIR
ncbi:MAG: hypothetical protein KDN22_29330, partial [Verrucomicrobiae bacterium]|nr:hypothetical protein [Verrucomicrobiae bacterium]